MKEVYVENGQSYNGRLIREGQCPHCGSDNLETIDLGNVYGTYYYDMECNESKGRWKDTYRMVFSSMDIQVKENEQ